MNKKTGNGSHPFKQSVHVHKPWVSQNKTRAKKENRKKHRTSEEDQQTPILCPDGVLRCSWCQGSPSNQWTAYHDKEWGRPDHSEHYLIEDLILGGFQSGLSWRSIVNKRENFRKDFDDFDCRKISAYDSSDIDRLMADPGIIRNRRKIEGAIANARMIASIQKDFGSLHDYVWHWTFGHRIFEPITTTTDFLSDLIAADMKKRGSHFLGSVTIFSYLQACGSICSHVPGCIVFTRFPPRKGDLIGNGYPTKGLQTDGDIHFA